METKLAVPIVAGTIQQAKKQINAAKAAGAEIIELRTDYLDNLSVGLIKKLIDHVRAAAPTMPIIVTCRDKKEGGASDCTLQLRIEVLIIALKAGADFIDFEYQNFLISQNQKMLRPALSQSPKARLILSAHNFKTRFDDIAKLYRDISAGYPAAVPKLVYTANHINDCFEAFDLLHNTAGGRIVFCMGEAGLISRIIAKKLGSFVTYASIDDKTATAPGQLTIEQLKTIYRWDSISSDTELYGLIGAPVAHSLGPLLHNNCFADIKANKLYLPLLVEGGKEEFYTFMKNIIDRPWLDFHGLSVTIPHKENAIAYVKSKQGVIDPLAKKIGAVNTLIIGDSTSEGKNRKLKIENNKSIRAYNTDCSAALNAITSALGVDRTGLKKMPVAVIGAGGAARAIVAGLADAGAKIKIYNRTVEKAERLAADFNCDFASLNGLPNLNAKLVINATSIGMYPNVNETPLPKEILEPASPRLRRSGKDMAVFDTVYNPPETLLLKNAKKAGAKTIPGLSMFLSQAAAQFKLFTGQNANIETMRKILSSK